MGLGERRQHLRAVLMWALVAVAGVTALALVLIVLLGIVVDHDLAGAHVTPADRLGAVNNARTTFLQAIGGLVLLFGAWATWRQLRVSQDGLRATQEGYITERFSRAVDQMGSEKLDVRIGGLHALWRIAEQSPRDREAAISIQAAYLRTHLPWPPTDPAAPGASVPINELAPLESRAPDVQVALTGLGVLCQSRSGAWVNVSATDLRRADCDGLWLNGVNLDGACLEAAGLYHANLTESSLVAVNLRHADLTTAVLRRMRCIGSDLRGAKLVETDLREADLTGADLREANLRKARAKNAVLQRADLRLADLRGTDLRQTDLATTRLEGALSSELTRWPDGFDPAATGVVVVPDPGPESGPLTQVAGITHRAPTLRSLP